MAKPLMGAHSGLSLWGSCLSIGCSASQWNDGTNSESS